MSGHLEYLRQRHGTRGRVEFCGGLVGDEQPGLDRERPGHGDALLLSARKFLDELVRVSLEPKLGQGAAGRGRRVWCGKARGAERDLDVFGGGQQ